MLTEEQEEQQHHLNSLEWGKPGAEQQLEAEYSKAFADTLAHGQGFMKDGKHVPRDEVYSDSSPTMTRFPLILLALLLLLVVLATWKRTELPSSGGSHVPRDELIRMSEP